jgi:hypothetical protein
VLNKISKFLFGGKSAMWTAIFTAVLTFFTWLLFQVNRQATNASIASQRAFISFLGVGGIEKISQGDPPSIVGYSVHLPMINSGNTATRISDFEISMALIDGAPGDGLEFESLPHSRRQKFVFGPKQAFDSIPVFVPLDSLSQVEQGKKHLILWGWNIYRDIFEKTPTHLSEFCIEIINPRWSASNRSNPSTELKIDNPPCPTHNCYDEDCGDYSKRVGEYK